MTVGYKLNDGARWELPLELTEQVPDTSNSDFPGGGTVRPKAVGIGITVNRETGEWEVWNASVVGPKVRDGKVATKRDYAIPFASPLDGEGGSEVAPDWLKELCQEWTDRANGVSRGTGLTDQQVYDINKRMESSLGLQPTREVLENVLGAGGISPNSPARGEAEVDEVASEFIKRQLKIALDDLEREAKALAERATLYAGPTIRVGKNKGDMSRLAQDSQQLALAAARLDGMREIAHIFVTED